MFNIKLEVGMIGVRLDKETEEKLEELARQTGRSKSYYVREALTEYLAEREDYLFALARLEKQGPRVSLEALERELGLEG
jgi:RHH-type rel operon transcriptional repressor/antitoxin RelB